MSTGPHDITDVIGDGALVFDVGIVPDIKTKSGVELLGEPRLEYNKMVMFSKEDTSVPSTFHWHKLECFIAENDLY